MDATSKIIEEAEAEAKSGNYIGIYILLKSPHAIGLEKELEALFEKAIDEAADLCARAGSPEGLKALLEDQIINSSGYDMNRIKERTKETYTNYFNTLAEKGEITSILSLLELAKKSKDKKLKEMAFSFITELSMQRIDMMVKQGDFESVKRYPKKLAEELATYYNEEVFRKVSDYADSKLEDAVNTAIEIKSLEYSSLSFDVSPHSPEVIVLASELEAIARREDLPFKPRVKAANRAADIYFSMGLSSLNLGNNDYLRQSIAALTDMLSEPTYDFDASVHREMVDTIKKIKDVAREKRRLLIEELIETLSRSKDFKSLYLWSIAKEIPDNLKDKFGKEANKILYEAASSHSDKKKREEALREMFSIMSKGVKAGDSYQKLKESIVIDLFEKFVKVIPMFSSSGKTAQDLFSKAVDATKYLETSSRYSQQYMDSVEVCRNEINKVEKKLSLMNMGLQEALKYAVDSSKPLDMRAYATTVAIRRLNDDDSKNIEEKLVDLSSWLDLGITPESKGIIKETFKNWVYFLAQAIEILPATEGQSIEERIMVVASKILKAAEGKVDLLKEAKFFSIDLYAKGGFYARLIDELKADIKSSAKELSENDIIAIKDYCVASLSKAIDNYIRLLRKDGNWLGLPILYLKLENAILPNAYGERYKHYSEKVKEKASDFMSSFPSLINEIAVEKILLIHKRWEAIKEQGGNNEEKERLIKELREIMDFELPSGLKGKTLGIDNNTKKMAWLEKVLIGQEKEDLEIFKIDLFNLFTSVNTSPNCRRMAMFVASTMPDTFNTIVDIGWEVMNKDTPYVPMTRAFAIETLAETASQLSEKEVNKAKEVISSWRKELDNPEKGSQWPEIIKEAVEKAERILRMADEAITTLPTEEGRGTKRLRGIIKIKVDTGGGRFSKGTYEEEGEFAVPPEKASDTFEKEKKKTEKPEEKDKPKKPAK
ncbi:MAG: hypothetical protein QW035_01650 [Candidatus Anstonellales archaeon]